MIKNTLILFINLILSFSLISCISSKSTSKSSNTNNTNKAPSSEIYSLVAGRSHVCILDKESTIKCWGTSLYGENGFKEDTEVPTELSLGAKYIIRGIAAGAYHSCFLTSENEVFCWGNNSKGQLGNLKVKKSIKPIKVNLENTTNDRIVALSLGDNFSCALFQTGTIKCWGDNSRGQLGNGTSNKQDIVSTVKMGTKDPVISVKSGKNHSCALLKNNSIKCWGDNSKGQLLIGNGSSFINIPEQINFSSKEGIRNLILKADSSCVLNNEGIAKCWGYAPVVFGVKSVVTTPLSINPKAFPKLRNFSMGDTHACYLSTRGDVQCMGANNYGQLGNGNTADSTTPVHIQNNERVKTLVSSDTFNCILLKKGTVKCWGNGDKGRLGNGNSTSSALPTNVSL